MAFVPQSSFIPRRNVPTHPSTPRRPHTAWFSMTTKVNSADAMEFFRHREGKWSSWRVTHHLAFKRSESGESAIEMRVLEKTDEQIQKLCREWDVDPEQAQGGCHVTWKATMAWDQEGENHEGSTVFALVPDENDVRKGKILRDRGYAEIVPIAGTYYMDDEDDLCLETPYDGGAVEERFSFDGPDVVNRVSTVRRFGGFSTATFATERRLGTEGDVEEVEDVFTLMEEMTLFGPGKISEGERRLLEGKEQPLPSASERFGGGPGRFATQNSAKPPSANSAFGSGFSSGTAAGMVGRKAANDNGNGADASDGNGVEGGAGISKEAVEAALKEGIDLMKIPPSMRDDFVASFNAEQK